MCRPHKPIDWEKVDQFLQAGCFGNEIAEVFHMHPHTFYDRVHAQYGMTFTEYSCLKKGDGDALLRHAQLNKALSGDNTMMVWLGKNRLEQRDEPKQASITQEVINNHIALMALITQAQMNSGIVVKENSPCDESSNP
jgi:hypothetical protein